MPSGDFSHADEYANREENGGLVDDERLNRIRNKTGVYNCVDSMDIEPESKILWDKLCVSEPNG